MYLRSPNGLTASSAGGGSYRSPAGYDYLFDHEPICSVRCVAGEAGIHQKVIPVDFEKAVKAVGPLIAGGHLGFQHCFRQAGLSVALMPRRTVNVTNGISSLHGLARQACCPAASRISRVISPGREISERWLAFTSMVLASIRLAMKRSRSGLIVRSSVETA
jgi:hypothetical protein